MLERVRSWRPTDTVLRRTFLGALVANTVIVVTGGAVRLTASGLGCPTFPRCTDESLVATREMGAHGAIEFGNRLLTFAVSATVVAAIVTAWRAGRRDLLRPAGLLFLGTVAQALLGGVTVLTGLNPLTVMAHFLLSMGLIAVAVVGYERAAGRRVASPDGPAATYDRALAVGAGILTAAVAVTLVIGTVVTGTGPHSGDKQAADRLPFDLEAVTQLHADAVFLVVGLTIGLVVAAAAAKAPRLLSRRLRALLLVVLAQGLVGYVQYVTDLPVALVATHMLGACLVWIATLLVLLAAVPARRTEDDKAPVTDAASAGSPPARVSAAAR